MSGLATALQYLKDQDLERADQTCRDMLAVDPFNAAAWHLRGVTLAQRVCLEDAVECFEKAAEMDSTSSLYPYNLAVAYQKQGELDQAVDAYRVAIDRRCDFLEARSNLGNTLIQQGRMLEAIDCFRELVGRFPDSGESHFNLANALAEIGKYDECLKHYRRAIELNPDHSAARENLGRALVESEQFNEARELWESWLKRDPGNEFAQHMLAAASGSDAPQRCSDDYIRQVFNSDFATTFDRQLSRLDYQSPKLIGQALDAISPPMVKLEILDAGCGTGLCGPIMRPLANHLVGVDLSPAMLAEARKRGVYDEITEAEITKFMESRPSSYDLILSSDTLCYFGDLSDVLAAAAQCLRHDGTLIFTVESETSQSEVPGYRLQPHGRYCHAPNYVRKVLAESGLVVREVKTAVQRNERGQPVDGLVVTATRANQV